MQLGNVDKETGKCCSGIRKYGANDCLDFQDAQGPHWYSCDVTGSNQNQQYRILESGMIVRADGSCLVVDAVKKKVKKAPCDGLRENQGVFEQIHVIEPKEYKIYETEWKKNQY